MSLTNFVSYSDATSILTKVGQKFSALGSVYTNRGSVTFANLPETLTAAMDGYVYNVTDDFTTDSRFIDGTGKKCKAGTNVSIVNVGTKQSPEMKFDVNGAFFNTSDLENKIDTAAASLSNSLADEFDSEEPYAVDAIVMHENQLYKFKVAHTANTDWNSTEVDPIDLKTLIENADPSSLTTAQVNALLALLD